MGSMQENRVICSIKAEMYGALHFSGSSALFLSVLITFSPSPLHSLPLPLPLSFLLLFALVQGVPVGGDSLGFPDLECSTLRGNLLSAPKHES